MRTRRFGEYTPELGRELSRRREKMRAEGGIPHAVVVRETQDEMERDLRRMVRDYDGSARRAKDLLEGLVIARDYGVAACDEIEGLLAQRLRRTA